MKKLVALAAGLVLALSLVLVQRASKASARPTQPAAETARLEAPPVVAPTRDEPLLQESLAREAVAAPPAPMKPNVEEARATELWVRAAWPDGTPAAEEVVLVRDGQSVGLDDAWEARTDPDGVARFLGLAPGSAYVSLLRGGETSTQLAVGETATVELTLRVGMTVVGSVFDDLGRPVPAAEVWLSKLYRTNVGHVVTRSDEAGRFEVRSVTRDHSIGVRKAGFAPSGLRRLSGKSGDRRELAFRLDQTGARVRGRVLDPGGAPFLRAQVLIGTEHPESLRIEDGSFAPAPPPQRARTDEQGRFELECVPLGLQPVQVRAPGHAPFLGEIEVLEDDRNELVVTLQGAPRVVGRVRGPSGTPLEAVWIRSSAAEDFASSSTWSRLDGSFVLSDLAIGPQTLLAQHTEHGEARLELRLSAGETREWEFELRPVPRIHGRLLDRRGAPLADLVVVALHDEDRTQRARSDPSDADGLFVLPNLEERPYLLWVQPPAQEGGWRVFPFVEEIDVWPSVAPIEITVPDASERGRLMAEIVALDGSPLVGAELQLWHQEARQWRAYGAGGERATVDVESIPPGTLDLEVRHPDHPWKRLGSRRLDAGATLDLGRIVLEPSGRLRVRLGGLAEQEYESLHALLSDASNRESGVATLAPGWLTTSPLQTGEHVLVLGGDGVRQVRLSFRIEEGVETELELRLEPCGSREVILELPAGASASWLQASLHEPGGALVWGGAVDRSGERPRVRVSAPPGPYRLVVSGTGGWHGESELVLGARGSTLPPLSILLRRDP